MFEQFEVSQGMLVAGGIGVLLGLLIGLICGRFSTGRGGAGARSDSDVVEMYVGNLSYNVSEKDLRGEFEPYGEVVSVRIIKNRFNGKSKGFGFVEIAGRNDASQAVRALNGKDIKGRKVVVNEAKSEARK